MGGNPYSAGEFPYSWEGSRYWRKLSRRPRKDPPSDKNGWRPGRFPDRISAL